MHLHISHDNSQLAKKSIDKFRRSLFRGRLWTRVVMYKHRVKKVFSKRIKIAVTTNVMLQSMNIVQQLYKSQLLGLHSHNSNTRVIVIWIKLLHTYLLT